MVCAIDYELGYLFEPKAAPPGWQDDKPVLARFWRFRERVAMSADEAENWLAPWQKAAAGVGGVRSGMAEPDYLAAVRSVQHWIAEGDCYQVNMTLPLQFDWFGAPLALYARLRDKQPVRYGGYIGDGGGGVLSLSPELFIERRGDRIVTRPMKGTMPRSAPAESLRQSTKDRAENLMIVDLLRNDLGRVATPGNVVVDELFTVEDYPTVWQMVSEVSASVPGRDWLDILQAMFPCGSITGAPKVRAMQIAAELEIAARGTYTGSLGWIAPNGDFRLNVAIRTLELAPGHQGKMGVGSGIVADSDAAGEWRECQLKSRFLRELDPGLLLIETLRREEGGYPSLDGHLARLQSSAQWFAFPYDETQVRAVLNALPVDGVQRVRLTLGADGVPRAEAFALAPEPAGNRYACLAKERIDACDPLRRHKTTARAIYDAALKALAGTPEVFDTVFLNQRGEVAEGARSNVFVERDGGLLTPPLESGALPGVLRAELLASGRAREATLYPADLADGFWLGNALRGLVRVAWQPES